MKILWLSHLVPYPPKGGVLQRAYHLLRGVARRHTVHLLAFEQRALMRATLGSPERGGEEAARELGEFCASITFLPIPCERRPYGKALLAARSAFTRAPYTVNWLVSEWMDRTVARFAREREFDLIHFDTISLAPYLRHFQRGERRVLDHHNVESQMMARRAGQERNPLKRAYFLGEAAKLRRYERRIAPEFDLHITCSDLDGERLAGVAPGIAIRTVPNGVDLDYFSPRGRPPVPESLVFAGGLNWYPNRAAMRYFIAELWPRLKAAFPGVTMNVIGSRPPPELIACAAGDPAFRLHGFVEDVRPYLEAAAVYVCPIRDGGGTRLKILDALAMKKAVVADPLACEGIEVREGSHLLFARNPDEYVERIGMLFQDEARRLALGEAGRALVEQRYSFRRIGEELAGLYENLVNTPRRHAASG